MELALKEMKQFVTFFDNKTKEPIHQKEEDDEKGDKPMYYFPMSLPTIDIYKLACLNKIFRMKIESFFKPLKLQDFQMYYDTIKFADSMVMPPDLESYEKDKNQKLMKRAFKNVIYGQSIFLPFKQTVNKDD